MITTTKLPIPAGMREVTKAEFYAAIGPLNVHPRPERTHSSWRMVPNPDREVGRSWPGYMCEGPTGYALIESIVPKA